MSSFTALMNTPLWSSSCASCLPASLPPANLPLPHPWFYVDALICLPYSSALAILVWIQVSQKHDACRASVFSPGVMETRHLQCLARTSINKQQHEKKTYNLTTVERGTVVLLVFGPFTRRTTILPSRLLQVLVSMTPVSRFRLNNEEHSTNMAPYAKL